MDRGEAGHSSPEELTVALQPLIRDDDDDSSFRVPSAEPVNLGHDASPLSSRESMYIPQIEEPVPEQGQISYNTQQTHDAYDTQPALRSWTPSTLKRSARSSIDSLCQVEDGTPLEEPSRTGYEAVKGRRYRQHPNAQRAGGIWSLWWSEILCSFLSICAFFGMIAVLQAFHDQPTTKWKIAISLNSVISILSAVFKAALIVPLTEGLSHLKWSWFTEGERPLSDVDVFDGASRDPLGSFRLLYRKAASTERPVLAMIGAITIVIAIALEPFSQATVEHYSCTRLDENQPAALLPRSNFYDPEIATIRSGSTILDVESQLAIYKGLLDPPANSSASMIGKVQCITGNCTFPHDQDGAAFSTVAMSYACKDISSSIIHTNETKKGVLQANYYTLPSGAQAEVWHTPRSAIVALMTVAETPDGMHNGTLEDWPIFTMETVMVTEQKNCTLLDNGTTACEDSSRNDWEHPSAYSCSLFPSMKAFTADVAIGAYTEREVSSTNLQNIGVGRDLDFNAPYWWLVTDKTLRNGSWFPCNQTEQNTTANTIEVYASNKSSCIYSRTGACEEGTPTLWYPRECVWELSQQTYQLIPELLEQLLNNQTVTVGDVDNLDATFGEPYMRRLFKSEGQGIHKFNAFMSGIASALTSVMRTDSNTRENTDSVPMSETLRYVHGDTWRTEICYSVQWGWLSYLVVLLVLEIGFLIAVVVKSASGRWNLDWKSSALVAFFHPLNTASARDKIGAWTKDGMLRSAREIKVNLVEEDGPWRFYVNHRGAID